MKRIKKIISTVIISLFLLTRTIPVLGHEVPQLPTAPSSPEAPSAPKAPEASAAPTSEQILNPEPVDNSEPVNQETSAETREPTNTPMPTSSPAPETGQFTGIVSQGNSGETEIVTGDAVNTADLFTQANTNLNLSTDQVGSNGNSTTQENNAGVENTLNLSTITGSNAASQNLGDSEIFTGSANTAATVVTAANTNIDGVAVAEFNVVDNHVGDIVLDFGDAVSANGTGVNSEVNMSNFEESTTFQENNAELGNNINLSSNSGDNNASLNTGGESEVDTGDANIVANVISFLNNNIAGNVVLGVVNIFGNLVGDIILPEGAFETDSLGSGSKNSSAVTNTSSSSSTQTNQAEIENNLNLKANTGGNEAVRNTGGETRVVTGDANVEARTVNVTNSNIEGGNLWLVIINEAGRWVGQIMGASENSKVAGSEGMKIVVDEKGNVSVQNSDNGASTDNNSEEVNENTTQTEQENNAKIVNNINLEANTGNNKANDNTGGNSKITTGDANIIANIINFVNNNVRSDGRILVTIINVFGDWVGNFLPPGIQKEEEIPNPIDGEENNEEIAEDTNDEYDDYDYSWDYEYYYWDESESSQEEEIGEVYYENTYLSRNFKSSGKVAGNTSEKEIEKPDNDSFLSAEAATDNNIPVNKVKINLAWLTLTLPLLGLTILLKRVIGSN